jgi:polysaccharide biosynthesis transport protein
MKSDLPARPEGTEAEAMARGASRSAALTYRVPALVAEAPADEEWRRYLSPIKRRKGLVILVTVIGTALGVVATRIVAPHLPFYTATSAIWIAGGEHRPDRNQDRAMPAPINSGQLLGASGWVNLARSYVVLDSVARELRLYVSWDSPADSLPLATLGLKPQFRAGDYRLEVDSAGQHFRLLSAKGMELERGVVGTPIGAALGFAWVPPAGSLTPRRAIDFSISSPYDAATVLAQRLQIEADPDGNFLQISLRGSDPAYIAAAVNAVAARFVDVAADLKRKRLAELTQILGEQLDHAQANLRRAETDLRSFRVRTATMLPGTGMIPPEALAPDQSSPPQLRPALGGNLLEQSRDPVFANFLNSRVALDQLRHDRAGIERVLAAVPDSGLAVDGLSLIASVQRSAELPDALRELVGKRADLRALRYRYTETNPEVRRVAGAIATLERQTIPTLARALLKEIGLAEAELARRVETASGDLRQLPTLAIDELRLERDVVDAEQVFTNIQQRSAEARLAEASSIPDVRVLDPAVEPQQPFINAAPFLILFAFMGSLGAGTLAAVMRDRVDPKVRAPEHVTQEMGLPILGAVPHFKAPNGKHGLGGHHGHNGDGGEAFAPVIEALRGLRLSLVHAHGTAGPLLVTITSPGRGEGKSFVAANMALAFANAGHSTLLIDGDIRRGQLHRVLNTARTPGLTNGLIDGTPPEAIVQATPYPRLSFIGCGVRTTAGPELLGSEVMGRLFATLRPRYEVILVDSPPLSVGVDPYILGTLTGNLLLVLRSGVSNRELAGAKLDALDRLPIRLLGAVLNDIRPDGAYRNYSYSPEGYELREEEASGPRGRVLTPG